MPISNAADVSYLDQAKLDKGDVQITEAAAKGTVVFSGGVVTAQGTPDGTVAVSSGTARIGGSNKTISAGNVSVLSGSANPDATTATAADSTQARFSLITLDSSDKLGVLHGENADLSPANDGSYLCVFPTFSSSTHIPLAAIFIPPGSTTVTSTMIKDKRIVGTINAFHDQAHTMSGASHTGDIAATQMLQLSAWSTYHNPTSSTADPVATSVLWTEKTFSKVGTIATNTDSSAHRWYNDTGRTLTFVSARATFTTAPTGQDAIIDIHKDGTTIMTGTKVVVAASANTGEQTTFSTATIADNSYLTVNVDQVGSSVAGADLVVQIWMVG